MSERWVWRLQQRPEGMDFEPAFELKSEPIPELAPGEILIKNIYIGMDSGTRNWLHPREDGFDVEVGVAVAIVSVVAVVFVIIVSSSLSLSFCCRCCDCPLSWFQFRLLSLSSSSLLSLLWQVLVLYWQLFLLVLLLLL